MAKGLYFYKLVSPYEEDVTKNCKLTVNEIDSNFLNLKDEDIKSAELDEETKAVILTRNNGDKLVVDLTPVLSGAVYDLEVVYDNPSDSEASCKGANIYITYSTLTSGDTKATVTVPIDGLVTTNNYNKILGGGLLTRVISDGSLTGKGTIDSPLGIRGTEKNRPAIDVVDKTKGFELPTINTIGDRYVTKEYISDFGYLYNFHGVEKIMENLELEGNGWRVPTKEDWDCLLNSIEPCDYRDHNSTMCHHIFGKYAGTKLKSKCGWLEEPECECSITKPISGNLCGKSTEPGDTPDDDFDSGFNVPDEEFAENEPEVVRAPYWGTDEFGMRILPTGYGDGDEIEHYFNKKTVFWTTTHVYNDELQDVYVKEFDWNKSGVIQEAQCVDSLFSIRLVKDYTGNNHFESEYIDGLNYNTILFPECGAIWTASNFAGDKDGYNPKESNMGMNPYKRAVYYINVWNGHEWEKRMLEEGETITIHEVDDNCQYNVEYRVFMEDGCNQTLVNVDDTVVERVIDRLLPIIDEEKEEREKADKELNDKLDSINNELTEAIEEERRERQEADELLQEQIDEEAKRAQDVEQQLWDALNKEAQAREEVDQQIWEALEKEANAREEVDTQIWDALNNEINDRIKNVTDLWAAIEKEGTLREEVDQQIWEALEKEAAAREQNVADLWAAIVKEGTLREEVDNQIWAVLKKEIEDRIADVASERDRAIAREDEIEGQLMDPEKGPYTLSVNPEGEYNMTLLSKDGKEEHSINIVLNSDYGTF